MNKKRLATIGSAALGITIATGISSAYAADGWQPFFANEENRESLEQSIQNDDYSTWSSLMAAQADYIHDEIDSAISEESFDIIQEAQELAESGDMKGAKDLLNDAGIAPMMTGHRGQKGHHKGKHMNSEEFEAVKGALESEDYDAWVSAISELEGPRGEDTSEEHYEHMLEMQELMESGDKESARELRKEYRESKMTDGEADEGSEA